MPSRAAARVVDLVDEAAHLVESLDVLGVLAEGEFDLGLLDDGVDAAQPVRFGIGQEIKAVEGVVEISHRLAVGPAALRLLSCQDRIVDRLFRLVAAAEMQRQKFRDFVAAAAVKFFERVPYGAVIDPAMPLEQAAIRGFLRQRMTKDTDSSLGFDALIDEFETDQLV